jgi:hypothetical protein
MTGSPNPTLQDIDNARRRQQIAARQAEEVVEADRLALAALGPGWIPWMKLSLLDSDHHRTGNTEAAATAYKVYRGEQRLTENSVYLRGMPDGRILHSPSYEPLFGDLLQEPHPTRTLDIRGKQVPCPRYHVCWSALELYEPRSAEQLAAARAKRELRAIDKAAESYSLFAEQIRSGALPAGKKARGRSPG